MPTLPIKFLTPANCERVLYGCFALGVEVPVTPETFERLEAAGVYESLNLRIDDREPGVWTCGRLAGVFCAVGPESVQLYIDHDRTDDGLDGTAWDKGADPENCWVDFVPALRALSPYLA